MLETQTSSRPGLPEAKAALDDIWTRFPDALPHILRTPFVRADRLSANLDCELWIKLENLQYTGAFKERGALARLISLSEEERTRGVVAASAGNHAQAVARHAGLMGIPATIVMPEGTPSVKVHQTELLGAKVVIAGRSYDEAYETCCTLRDEAGAALVHPFDDPYVIAGQSTLAREMVTDQDDLDIILAPIGGGGLAAGTVLAMEKLQSKTQVIGVQSNHFASMANAVDGQSREIGGSTLAEGIAVKTPGALPVEILKPRLDEILLVDEPGIERAVVLLLSEMRQQAEGAGAAGLAAVLSQPERFKGKKIGLMLCGGNIDGRMLSSILLRGLVRSGRMKRLRVELVDIPGQLVDLSTAIAQAGGNVVDVAYHRTFSDLPAKITYIDISVEALDSDHMSAIIDTVRAQGFKVSIASY